MVPAKAAPVKAITVNNGKPTADETSEEEESEPEEEPKVQSERFVI